MSTVLGGVAFLTLAVLLYLSAKAIMRWLQNYRNRQDGSDGNDAHPDM